VVSSFGFSAPLVPLPRSAFGHFFDSCLRASTPESSFRLASGGPAPVFVFHAPGFGFSHAPRGRSAQDFPPAFNFCRQISISRPPEVFFDPVHFSCFDFQLAFSVSASILLPRTWLLGLRSSSSFSALSFLSPRAALDLSLDFRFLPAIAALGVNVFAVELAAVASQCAPVSSVFDLSHRYC
jgi:hypothetical protein